MKKYAVALLVALIVVATWLTWSRFQNRLVVANESGQAAAFLTITAGGETIRFDNLPDGEAVSASFAIRGDHQFVVRGQLEDGTEIAKECGYVTNGMSGVRASFILRPGGRLDFHQ